LVKHFDYIIIGAGCAGLSLALRIVNSKELEGKKVLLVDKSLKITNDRTWCFWEKGNGFFENLVFHSWDRLSIAHPKGEIPLDMNGYAYKMIRGIDFYTYGLSLVKDCPDFQIIYGELQEIDEAAGIITVNESAYSADYIFSSVLKEPIVVSSSQHYLLQHFKGWWIETDEDVFDDQEADLMNFNTSQQHGCAFMYVLPVSKRKALVEYTLFTADELQEQEYDNALKLFLQDVLNVHKYRIVEVEKGRIPMTNFRFPVQSGKVIYIGTAGGKTKGSTGYTFQFIQKHSEAIVNRLSNGLSPAGKSNVDRFAFYDSVLLGVLKQGKPAGDALFYRLFQKNTAAAIFRFLDNESTVTEELSIMQSTQKGYFIPAALREMLRLLKK